MPKPVGLVRFREAMKILASLVRPGVAKSSGAAGSGKLAASGSRESADRRSASGWPCLRRRRWWRGVKVEKTRGRLAAEEEVVAETELELDGDRKLIEAHRLEYVERETVKGGRDVETEEGTVEEGGEEG